MRGTLRIGRLLGVGIHLDWSWLVVFGLLTWNVTVLFRGWHPSWAAGPALFLAAVATLSFFLSIVVHEAAHAFVAQRFGLRVRQVRVFLFGGVSDIEREPSSPGAECWMALVGPIVSISFGVLLTWIASRALGTLEDAGAAMMRLSPLQTVIFWVGPMNIALGVFNLLPGFPLDGGRLVRAALWKATGNLPHATYVAATLGRMIGVGLVIVGIAMALGVQLPFLGQGPAGLWVALIGWYLRVAAERSFVAVVADDVLEGVRVAKLMRSSGPTVEPLTTIRSAVDDALTRSSDHALPVVEGTRLVGLVSIHDFHKVPRSAWDRTAVRAVMTPTSELVSVGPEDTVRDAVAKLAHHDVSQLPVIEGDSLAGMFSRRDVARWFELSVTAARGTRRPLAPIPRLA